MRLAYADTSAILSVVFDEPGAGDVTDLLGELESGGVQIASSRLVVVETHRAALRVAQLLGTDDYDRAAIDRLLDSVRLFDVDARVIEGAIRLRPYLKTLDSVHVATALMVEDRLEGMVSLDAAMRSVAVANGIRIIGA